MTVSRCACMIAVVSSAPFLLTPALQVWGNDTSKDGKPKILCLFEEVKGTAVEFLEADGKPGKPRNIAEENKIRLAIPKAILDRLAEISTKKDVSGLEELRLIL